jgi:hypothetical protein
MINKSLNQLILFLAGVIIFIGAGCGDGERETPQTENGQSDRAERLDTTTEGMDTTALMKKESIPDITGVWKGKLDNHASTLRITEQDGLDFKGRINTKFRQEINQEVSGKLNPDNRTLTMKDMLHSRYEGTYSAKLSENMDSMKGTFIMQVDNSKLNFSYNKE